MNGVIGLTKTTITDTDIPEPIEDVAWFRNLFGPEGTDFYPYGGIFSLMPRGKMKGGSVKLPRAAGGHMEQEGYGKSQKCRCACCKGRRKKEKKFPKFLF